MKPFNIPAGAQVLLGAAAKPMPSELRLAIAKVVGAVPGIVEAHMPQCLVQGVMTSPAEVLVIVLASDGSESTVVSTVGEGLNAVLASGRHLDVWPMALNSGMLEAVRRTNCRIFAIEGPARPPSRKPWWRFWSAG